MDTKHKLSSHKALRSSLKQVFEDIDYRISETEMMLILTMAKRSFVTDT